MSPEAITYPFSFVPTRIDGNSDVGPPQKKASRAREVRNLQAPRPGARRTSHGGPADPFEVGMTHSLSIDFRGGMIFAACQCGGWAVNHLPSTLASLSELYELIERDFRGHVRATSGEPASDVPTVVALSPDSSDGDRH